MASSLDITDEQRAEFEGIFAAVAGSKSGRMGRADLEEALRTYYQVGTEAMPYSALLDDAFSGKPDGIDCASFVELIVRYFESDSFDSRVSNADLAPEQRAAFEEIFVQITGDKKELMSRKQLEDALVDNYAVDPASEPYKSMMDTTFIGGAGIGVDAFADIVATYIEKAGDIAGATAE